MPIYEWECPKGHVFDKVLPYSESQSVQVCACGETGKRIISRPMAGFVQREVCFDSPIDGRPITSRRAWKDDMARNGCREYDPGMKEDYQRRVKRDEAELDKSVDSTVDEMIEKMPARQLEKLESELRSGADATIERR